jgi:hypothetical protein
VKSKEKLSLNTKYAMDDELYFDRLSQFENQIGRYNVINILDHVLGFINSKMKAGDSPQVIAGKIFGGEIEIDKVIDDVMEVKE